MTSADPQDPSDSTVDLMHEAQEGPHADDDTLQPCPVCAGCPFCHDDRVVSAERARGYLAR